MVTVVSQAASVVLIPMTAHRKGPYTEWLAAVDRAATLEINNQGKLQP